MKLMVAAILFGAAASASPSADIRQSWDVHIPLLPPLVASGGRSLTAFEVHATNFTDGPLELRSVRIIDDAAQRPLVVYGGQALAARLRIVGAGQPHPATIFPAGARAVIFVELDLPPGQPLGPLRVEMDGLGADGHALAVRSDARTVDAGPIPVLAPPLKTGTWVAVHDPSWDRGHRRVFYTLGGRARLPGRYAIDWVGVDDKGRVTTGDADRPADAIGYGASVLAGADAVVAAVRDDMQEASSIANSPVQPLGSGSGNYVVLRLGANRFAFYEHLRPGSITVRVGDRVRAGQTIGALGFTGDTTGPHLHLHVADCAAPLACEGVPFTISGMTERGAYRPLSDLGSRRWAPAGERGRLGAEWPGYNVVVEFTGGV